MLVSSNGGSGFPATTGSTSTAARIACTSVPFPGAFPAAVGNRQVQVGREPLRALVNRVRAVREHHPVHIRVKSLDDGDRLRVAAPDGTQPVLLESGVQPLTTDHEHRRPLGELARDQLRRRLRGRHHVLGDHIQPERREVLGDDAAPAGSRCW